MREHVVVPAAEVFAAPGPAGRDLVVVALHLDRAVVFVVSHVTEVGVPRTHWKRFEWSADLGKMMKVIEDMTTADREESKNRGVELYWNFDCAYCTTPRAAASRVFLLTCARSSSM